MNAIFRSAVVADIEAAVPLIFASGRAAFRYVFSVDHEKQALDFLAYSFNRGDGEFCDNHRVTQLNGEVLAIGDWWHSGNNLQFMLSVMRHVVAFYGLAKAIGD